MCISLCERSVVLIRGETYLGTLLANAWCALCTSEQIQHNIANAKRSQVSVSKELPESGSLNRLSMGNRWLRVDSERCRTLYLPVGQGGRGVRGDQLRLCLEHRSDPAVRW